MSMWTLSLCNKLYSFFLLAVQSRHEKEGSHNIRLFFKPNQAIKTLRQ